MASANQSTSTASMSARPSLPSFAKKFVRASPRLGGLVVDDRDVRVLVHVLLEEFIVVAEVVERGDGERDLAVIAGGSLRCRCRRRSRRGRWRKPRMRRSPQRSCGRHVSSLSLLCVVRVVCVAGSARIGSVPGGATVGAFPPVETSRYGIAPTKSRERSHDLITVASRTVRRRGDANATDAGGP